MYMPNDTDLTQKIMDKVQKGTMKPKWFFLTTESLQILTIATLLFFAVFLTTFFIWDLYRNVWIFGSTGNLSGTIISSTLFEFLGAAIISGLLIYLIYRHTDWFFVQHRLWLVVGIVGIVTVFSGIFALTVLNNDDLNQSFENTEEQTRRLPGFDKKREALQKELEAKNIFTGKIIEIQEIQDKKIITVQNPDKTVIFITDMPMSSLKQDKVVAVRYKEVDGQKIAIDIRPFRPAPPLP